MNNIVPRHGNGNGSVNGRGVLRQKLTPTARIALAADIATGKKHLDPSIKQAAAAVGVSPYRIRKELQARAGALEAVEQAERIRDEAGYIIHAWTRASTQVRQEAIRCIGVANVWDTLASVVG
jgi:hypothetical protein